MYEIDALQIKPKHTQFSTFFLKSMNRSPNTITHTCNHVIVLYAQIHFCDNKWYKERGSDLWLDIQQRAV